MRNFVFRINSAFLQIDETTALIFSFLALLQTSQARQLEGEWIIIVGGPSLISGRNTKPIRTTIGGRTSFAPGGYAPSNCAPSAAPTLITWLVYKQGYVDRAQQEKQDLIGHINSVRDKFNLNLIYFHAGSEVINYLNAGRPRDQMKIACFEFFGHSNRACFMFDYSNVLDSASKSWLHEDELTKINRRDFARGAFVKSWGCHTGESMSKKWHRAIGIRMIGAIGRPNT